MSFSSSPVIGKAMKSEASINIAVNTGNEKKILDATRSLLCILKDWDNQHSSGKIALASIMKLRDSIGWKLEILPEGPKLDALQQACNNLCTIVEEMDASVNSVSTLAYQINLLAGLEKSQSQALKTAKLPVFPSGTWDCSKFGMVFETIADAFREDMKVLKIVKESAAQSQSKSALITYIARWNFLNCTSSVVSMLLIGLLSETAISNS